EYFADKEDCFLAAYDVVSERLIRALISVGLDRAPGRARRRVQLDAFLAALAKDPAPARVFVVDVLGAGARALARRERVNMRFADAVLGDTTDDPILLAAIVGGINNVVAGHIREGRASALPSLLGPLAAFMERALASERR